MQRPKQLRGLPDVGSFESFSKRRAQRAEQFATLPAPTLVSPKPRQADRRAQLKRFGGLASGRRECCQISALTLGCRSAKRQQLRLNPLQFGFPQVFFVAGHEFPSLGYHPQASFGCVRTLQCCREHAKITVPGNGR